MVVKIDSLAADLKRERDGDWIEPKSWPGLNPENPNQMVDLPGVAFHVRSVNYSPYVTARQTELERIKQDYPDSVVPPDVASQIEGSLAAEHLLLGWRGFDTEYSAAAAADTVKAPEHRNIRAIIYWCAGRVGKKKVEFVTAAAKN